MTVKYIYSKDVLPKIDKCPFCSYFAHVHSRKAKSAADGYHHFVRCPMCHTEGPRSLSSQYEAIIKWNARRKEPS